MAEVAELVVADEPGAWEALGFEVDGGTCVVGGVSIRLAGPGAGRGLVRWALSGAAGLELDGLATEVGDVAERLNGDHPNGTSGIDHVVAFSPRLDRTVAALEAAGLDLRRIREEPTPAGAPRQAFFRLGGLILEVIQQHSDHIRDPDGPARLWGLAFLASDLEALAQRLGEHARGPRDAVQPGRRILTLRRSAGLSVPLAWMSARP